MSEKGNRRTLNLGDLALPRPAIVASLGGDALATASEAEGMGADLIEVRLDKVKDPLETIKKVRTLASIPLIATNRIQGEGGEFLGSEEERLEILCQASKYADLVDIELKAGILEEAVDRIDRPFIVSYHDFQGCPGKEEIRVIISDAFDAGAAIAKVAVTPTTLRECLTILEVLLEEPRPVCMIGMGEIGRHMRAVAPLYGSVLTYGYVSEAVAPGQMSVSDLFRAFEIMGIRS
jgi:3-dehydroquinate dehydratase-1